MKYIPSAVRPLRGSRKTKEKKKKRKMGAKARIWIAMGAQPSERGKEKNKGTGVIRDCTCACRRLSNRVAVDRGDSSVSITVAVYCVVFLCR